MNDSYKNLMYGFVIGQVGFDEFMRDFQSNFDDFCTTLQDKINSLSPEQLNEFINEYSHPVFEEITFFREQFENEIRDKKDILIHYNKPIPSSINENATLVQAIEENKQEILNGYKDIKSMLSGVIFNNSFNLIYCNTKFLWQDIVFDTIAKLYDGLYGKVANKNYEYKIQKCLIIDSDLDKFLREQKQIEQIVEEKIFKPTQYLTFGKNPNLETYNKRLEQVKQRIKTFL